MLFTTRGTLAIKDCDGRKIEAGMILEYMKNGERHVVTWSEEKGCYCLQRNSDHLLMRIGRNGKWKPEKFRIVHPTQP